MANPVSHITLSVHRRWWVTPCLLMVGIRGSISFLFHRDQARAERWMTAKVEDIAKRGLIVKADSGK